MHWKALVLLNISRALGGVGVELGVHCAAIHIMVHVFNHLDAIALSDVVDVDKGFEHVVLDENSYVICREVLWLMTFAILGVIVAILGEIIIEWHVDVFKLSFFHALILSFFDKVLHDDFDRAIFEEIFTPKIFLDLFFGLLVFQFVLEIVEWEYKVDFFFAIDHEYLIVCFMSSHEFR